MFAKFFKAPTYSGGTWSTFLDDRLFVTDSIESYEYTKLFTKTGSFTMTLPFSENILKKLVLNGTIFFDNDWLWVQSIQYDGRKITISGKAQARTARAFLIPEYHFTAIHRCPVRKVMTLCPARQLIV